MFVHLLIIALIFKINMLIIRLSLQRYCSHLILIAGKCSHIQIITRRYRGERRHRGHNIIYNLYNIILNYKE